MRVGCGSSGVAVVWLVAVMGVACATEAETAQRTERSANLSHITGTARKIRMYVKNRFLQLLPDGSVNGSMDDTTDYSILQRQSVKVGQVKIQGVATCLYLCMDSCGLLYTAREFSDDCVFNEMIEQHHYNTYSSTKYSNHRRTVYLALNKRGTPRRVQIKATAPLGKLSTYTRVLTRTVAAGEVEALARRLLQQYPGAEHHIRHHQLCPVVPGTTVPEAADVDQRCRRRKKRRKKRRCKEGEEENEDCHKPKDEGKKKTVIVRKRCEEGEGKDKCQHRRLHMVGRKRKSRHETKRLLRHLDYDAEYEGQEEHDDTTAPEDDDVMTTDPTSRLDTNDQ